MGSLGGLMRLMPGMSKEMRKAADNVDDREIDRIEGIVRSMTPAEREDPSLIDGSRRRRIAAGSGRTIQDVNQLLNQFRQMQKMMKQMGGGGGMPGMPGMPKGRMAMARQMMKGGGDLAELQTAMGGASPAGTGLPPELTGFKAQGASASSNPPRGGSKNKKKKGGRVTPPKSR
jgi:hypothetical protein